MYEYGHEQANLRKKRWNDKDMLLKINMQTEKQKVNNKKKGGGVLMAPPHKNSIITQTLILTQTQALTLTLYDQNH